MKILDGKFKGKDTEIKFGKYKGKSVGIETVMITDPKYLYYLNYKVKGEGYIKEHINDLSNKMVEYFDWSPIRKGKSCSNPKCKSGLDASFLIAKKGSCEKVFVCKSCFEMVTSKSKDFKDISTYDAVLEHASSLEWGSESFVSSAITLLYEAKGGDFRAGNDEIHRFFNNAIYFKSYRDKEMKKNTSNALPLI